MRNYVMALTGIAVSYVFCMIIGLVLTFFTQMNLDMAMWSVESRGLMSMSVGALGWVPYAIFKGTE